MVERDDITGLVLAGGRGSRLGGVDKGLVVHAGAPLAQTALRRLAPQVGPIAISANRHLAAYAVFGALVWPDEVSGQPGPLAGLLTGLQRCDTRFLATVPCDAPNFPADLVERLAASLADSGADLAVAVADGRRQPVFCLVPARLAADLSAYLATGERRVGAWLDRHRVAEAAFDAPGAFDNLNTEADLRRAAGNG